MGTSDDLAQNVEGDPVAPAGAGGEEKRHRFDALEVFGHAQARLIEAARNAGFDIGVPGSDVA